MTQDSEGNFFSKIIGAIKGPPEGVAALDNDTFLRLEKSINELTEEFNALLVKLLQAKRLFIIQGRKHPETVQSAIQEATISFQAKRSVLKDKYSAAKSLRNKYPDNSRIKKLIANCEEKTDFLQKIDTDPEYLQKFLNRFDSELSFLGFLHN